MKRVFITGTGLHTGFGNLVNTWKAICADRSALCGYKPPGAHHFPEILAAKAQHIDLEKYVPDRKMMKYMSMTSKLAVLAAGRALNQARLLENHPACRQMAMFVTTGMISFDLIDVSRAAATCKSPDGRLDYISLGTHGLKMCHPLMPFKMLHNMPLGLISILYGLKGENFINYPTAEQSGICLQTAWRGICLERFEIALVGGSVHGLGLMPLVELLRKKQLALNNQPIRAGWPVNDTSAFLVLESEESTAMRGVQPLAELKGAVLSVTNDLDIQPKLESWMNLFASKPPNAIVYTGALDGCDAQYYERAAANAWSPTVSDLISFDDHIGYGQSAALLSAVVLATDMLTHQKAPDWSRLPPPSRLLVVSKAPQQNLVSVRLDSVEASS